jgi:hypothetical protein
VAAAVLEAFQLYPVILHEQANFLGPGLRAVQIGEKGPGTGAGLAFLTHAHDSFRLSLGLNIPGVTGDHGQCHAVAQLFRGGVLGALKGVQGTPPSQLSIYSGYIIIPASQIKVDAGKICPKSIISGSRN